MFFALTDDQRDFGTAVRDYLASEFDLHAVRGIVQDPDGDGLPESLWRAMGEQGWLAVLVPEEHDGLGLGMVDAQVIARELGAGTAPGPWRGTVLAAEAIRLAGSKSQQQRWLPALAAGEVAGALALRGTAESGWPAVEYARAAGVIVVADGPSLRLLRPDDVSVTTQDSFDGTTRLGSVTPADSAGGVPVGRQTGCPTQAAGSAGEQLPGATAEVLEQLHARSAVLLAAELVGIAREALRRTVDYDRERKQFGVPVGSFQALKHHLADLHIGVTMAEHAVLYAAHATDTAAEDVALAVSVAKAKASEMAVLATGAMIQYHGGIGYTWEHEAHFFYKRAKRLAGLGGTVDEQRERIAALTLG